jgi:hypothetical protein
MKAVQQQVALIAYASSSEQMNKLTTSWQDDEPLARLAASFISRKLPPRRIFSGRSCDCANHWDS